MKESTLAVQSGKDVYGATQVPIYLSAAYACESPEALEKVFRGESFGYLYSRIQNPTVREIERKVAGVAKAKGAALTSTGMAAISGTILTLVKAGDSLVCHHSLFGGTIQLLDNMLGKLGVQVRYADFQDIEGLEKAIDESTSLIFAETMGNPALDLIDVPEVARIAEKWEIPLVLDATLTPPGVMDLSRWKVAVGIHSTTKYLTGNGSVLGGVVLDYGGFPWKKARDKTVLHYAKSFGESLGFLGAFRFQALQNGGFSQQPFAAALLGMGLESMSIRLERQIANAYGLAKYFEGEGFRVNYPGLESSPYYQRSRELFSAKGGGILCVDFTSKERAFKFGNSLKTVRHMTNLGDLRTLIVHPESTIFLHCDEETKRRTGVTPGLMRISAGIEDIDDLIEDVQGGIHGIGQ